MSLRVRHRRCIRSWLGCELMVARNFNLAAQPGYDVFEMVVDDLPFLDIGVLYIRPILPSLLEPTPSLAELLTHLSDHTHCIISLLLDAFGKRDTGMRDHRTVTRFIRPKQRRIVLQQIVDIVEIPSAAYRAKRLVDDEIQLLVVCPLHAR